MHFMCYTYFLKSLRNEKRYVGSTRTKPKERAKQHNYGSNSWSRQNKPFELVHFEKYANITEARKRENFFKSGVGRQELNRILGK